MIVRLCLLEDHALHRTLLVPSNVHHYLALDPVLKEVPLETA